MTEERDIVEGQPAAESTAAGAEPVPDPEVALAEDAAPEAQPVDEPDWKDLALRKAAELENVRKQTAQRVQKASRDGMRRIASELLPALDDFERALAHAEAEEGDAEHHLTAGIRLVQQKMLDALRRAGIEQFSPKGEPFDPHQHEAVAQQPAADGAAPGTVLEVLQNGYRLGEDVLRPARVVVAG
jgi:molecular chaperone GrpE